MFKSRVQKILYINTKGQHKINQNKFPLQHDLYFRFRLCNSCVCVCVSCVYIICPSVFFPSSVQLNNLMWRDIKLKQFGYSNS